MKMTKDNKMEICKLRLEGSNIYDTASEVGYSKQAVLNFIKKLPAGSRKGQAIPKISMSAMLDICCKYIHEGLSDADIAATVGLPLNTVQDVFAFIASRRLIEVKTKRYPALTRWMKMNGYTLQRMSTALRISSNTLSATLNGRRHMSYDMAAKIKRITGIPMHTIFEGQLPDELIRREICSPSKATAGESPRLNGGVNG